FWNVWWESHPFDLGNENQVLTVVLDSLELSKYPSCHIWVTVFDHYEIQVGQNIQWVDRPVVPGDSPLEIRVPVKSGYYGYTEVYEIDFMAELDYSL
ncbi:MAG: hypothetical protein LUD68_05180, partial [Rikenellaceae bacterium]|nr:hypothetical protein [Rikenellaceae bacterium]